tara:strand:- start:2750 stop:3097 length:348 start_codon:yes stop_codon:yes gene_type:complete
MGERQAMVFATKCSRESDQSHPAPSSEESIMTIYLIVFGAMLLIIGAMAIGVILGRKPIAGSCGGLNQLGLKDGCEICGGKDEVCEEESKKRATSQRRQSDENRGLDLGYDATRR